jgi:glucose/mannose transport system permease protein
MIKRFHAFKTWTPWLALLPLLLTVIVAYLGTGLWSLWISLTNSRTFPTGNFVGLAQYERLLHNERWLLSLQNLALYGVLFMGVCLLIGFLLAVLIDQKVRMEGAFRTIFLYPYAMSFIATGLAWQWALNPTLGIQKSVNQWGFENFQFDWIVDQDMVIYTLVIASVWQAAGLVMALLLAGLRGVDEEIWKAARMDGIPTWRVYISIVLPAISPTLATVCILLLTAVVKLFDVVVAMTQGGPGTASEVPAKFIMDHLFGRANIGLASAGAVVLLLTVLSLSAPFLYLRSRQTRGEGRA